jgi:hypothetical protein
MGHIPTGEKMTVLRFLGRLLGAATVWVIVLNLSGGHLPELDNIFLSLMTVLWVAGYE